MNDRDCGFKLAKARIYERKDVHRMSAATGTDWTRILSDPDLVRQVGKLLQAYREAPAEKREEALLTAMREIKAGVSSTKNPASGTKEKPVPQPVPTPTQLDAPI